MARGKPVSIGNITFRTRQEGLSFFKEMLSKYRPEDAVGESDSIHLTELLKRHPDYAEKIGNGIHHFEVMSADFNTKCFAVVRRDGTRIDFSYKICVNTEPRKAIDALGHS
ncbi:DCL family protein [Bradyrhizobium sp. LHD-71]|uniref:DCL family protein n=1 Tax=Bradyrhizobium sp. LHD-71 TaxID=3072141 RepID=UPI00280E1D86|nr:DCL family protein [Bradyrhizobium sp. LHD-71]MDQ8730682.1 DCL family protein [Bradyrhizobium sp. LHD-71]